MKTKLKIKIKNVQSNQSFAFFELFIIILGHVTFTQFASLSFRFVSFKIVK